MAKENLFPVIRTELWYPSISFNYKKNLKVLM